MKRMRHTLEQIVRELREDDRLLAKNIPLAEVIPHSEIDIRRISGGVASMERSDLMMSRDLNH